MSIRDLIAILCTIAGFAALHTGVGFLAGPAYGLIGGGINFVALGVWLAEKGPSRRELEKMSDDELLRLGGQWMPEEQHDETVLSQRFGYRG